MSVPHIVFNVIMLPMVFVPYVPSRAQLDLCVRQIVQEHPVIAPPPSPLDSLSVSNQFEFSSSDSDILPKATAQLVEPIVKSPTVPVKITKKIHNPYGCYVVRINGRPIAIKGPTTRKIVTYVNKRI